MVVVYDSEELNSTLYIFEDKYLGKRGRKTIMIPAILVRRVSSVILDGNVSVPSITTVEPLIVNGIKLIDEGAVEVVAPSEYKHLSRFKWVPREGKGLYLSLNGELEVRG